MRFSLALLVASAAAISTGIVNADSTPSQVPSNREVAQRIAEVLNRSFYEGVTHNGRYCHLNTVYQGGVFTPQVYMNGFVQVPSQGRIEVGAGYFELGVNSLYHVVSAEDTEDHLSVVAVYKPQVRNVVGLGETRETLLIKKTASGAPLSVKLDTFYSDPLSGSEYNHHFDCGAR